MALILGSQSPRRQELLRQMGLTYRVCAANIEETMEDGGTPEEKVAALSAKKAAAVAEQAGAEDIIIAADTIVVVEQHILGKPRTPEEAKAMLTMLSGRRHRVMTGYTVRQGDRAESHTEVTELEFRKLSQEEIRAYTATGDPMDKAGAYGIQGPAGIFVKEIHGDYYNVMGLPICALTGTLRRFGVRILGEKGTP